MFAAGGVWVRAYKMDRRKVIILGLDGVPFELLQDLAQSNVMPCVKDLIKNSILKKMNSSLPEISSVAWSSVITGVNPAAHGIFGFTDFYPTSYKLRFPNFNDLKAPAFWHKEDLKSVIINVPSTFPVRPLNGVHISGFVSIDLERSVYPSNLLNKLQDLDYRLDVDSQKAHQSMDLFLSDLDDTHRARIKTYRYLWDYFNWQVFMLVFTGSDRLMHFLWKAYEDKNHKYNRDFLEYFRTIDTEIADIVERMSKDDVLVMLSDHGFGRLDHDVYINDSTKAFAMDPARIYINLEGKYPSGKVKPNEKEKVIEQVVSIFEKIEVDGRKVVKSIHRKEHIYSGSYFDNAPDLVLLGNEGFNLKANIKTDKLNDKSIFSGRHVYDNAFFLIKADADKPYLGDDFSVYDVMNTVSKFFV